MEGVQAFINQNNFSNLWGDVYLWVEPDACAAYRQDNVAGLPVNVQLNLENADIDYERIERRGLDIEEEQIDAIIRFRVEAQHKLHDALLECGIGWQMDVQKDVVLLRMWPELEGEQMQQESTEGQEAAQMQRYFDRMNSICAEFYDRIGERCKTLRGNGYGYESGDELSEEDDDMPSEENDMPSDDDEMDAE